MKVKIVDCLCHFTSLLLVAIQNELFPFFFSDFLSYIVLCGFLLHFIFTEVLKVSELREKTLGDFSHLTVRQLTGYLACSDDVDEMLPPFKIACGNHYFQDLWIDRTKQLSQSTSTIHNIELDLDGIAKRVRAEFI